MTKKATLKICQNTMMSSEIVAKYFPDLSEHQRWQYAQLDALYHEWNSRINVISRQDIDNLYEHHVLHSLAISKMATFKAGDRILDFGTGGGFPGIPLAIFYPDCDFTLIDGTGKKIRVAKEVCNAIGLKNCHPIHKRGEEETGKYDYVVSRAVMPLDKMAAIVKKNIDHKKAKHGIYCLKGGILDEEISPFKKATDIQPVSQWFAEEWFKQKFCIFVSI